MRRVVLAAAAVVAALAMLPPDAGAQNLTNCSTTSQNRYVNDVMRDIYYWNTELPTVNTASFGSPEALLEALRFRPLDERFSYIGAQATEEAFYSDSQFIGFGFANGYDGQGLRILQVFPDSPAAETGMSRGDRITSIEGRSVVALAESGTLGNALGPSQEGVTIRFRYERPDGSAVDASMTKRPVTIPTVSHTTVFEADGAWATCSSATSWSPRSRRSTPRSRRSGPEGRRELVLDLRYNGGGLVDVAQYLGSLIGGDAHRRPGVRRVLPQRSQRVPQRDPAVRRAAGSAAARAAGGHHDAGFGVGQRARDQRPAAVHPVVIVGDRTYGKPVGQYAIPFCDKILAPVSFQLATQTARATSSTACRRRASRPTTSTTSSVTRRKAPRARP